MRNSVKRIWRGLIGGFATFIDENGFSDQVFVVNVRITREYTGRLTQGRNVGGDFILEAAWELEFQ